MCEAGTAALDELGNRALIAFGVALFFAKLLRWSHAWIVVHQKLELAVANGDEDIAQAAEDLRRTCMVDSAVLVGDEALGDVADLDIGLRAVQRTTEIVDEHTDAAIVIVAGDAQMVDFVSRAVASC